jgi:hypothetical protein
MNTERFILEKSWDEFVGVVFEINGVLLLGALM